MPLACRPTCKLKALKAWNFCDKSLSCKKVKKAAGSFGETTLKTLANTIVFSWAHKRKWNLNRIRNFNPKQLCFNPVFLIVATLHESSVRTTQLVGCGTSENVGNAITYMPTYQQKFLLVIRLRDHYQSQVLQPTGCDAIWIEKPKVWNKEPQRNVTWQSKILGYNTTKTWSTNKHVTPALDRTKT